jgi:hypothetical protein
VQIQKNFILAALGFFIRYSSMFPNQVLPSGSGGASGSGGDHLTVEPISVASLRSSGASDDYIALVEKTEALLASPCVPNIPSTRANVEMETAEPGASDTGDRVTKTDAADAISIGDHIAEEDAAAKSDETKDTVFPSISEDHILEELSAEVPVSQIIENAGDHLSA